MNTAISFDRGLGALMIKRWPAVLLAWVLILGFALPLAGNLQHKLVVSGEIKGSEALMVSNVIEKRFPGAGIKSLVLVISGAPDILLDDRQSIESLIDEIGELREVGKTLSYLTTRDRYLLSPNRDGLLVVVQLAADADDSGALSALRALAARHQTALRNDYPDISLLLAGDVAVRDDLVTASNKDLGRSELRALPLAFLLLLFAFRSFVAATIPVVIGVSSVIVALGAVSLVAEYMSLSIMVQSVISLLGLALGIDYALLLVTRFREALGRGTNNRDAVLEAIGQGGRTIWMSGITVAIGFAALILVPVDQLRSIAIGGLIVALTSVLLATTVLPVLLMLLGKRIDAGRLPGQSRGLVSTGLWRRWATFVTRRYVLVIVVFGVPLIGLGSFAGGLSVDFPSNSWLPRQAPSVRALAALAEMERGGITNRIQVVYELPEGRSIADEAAWTAVKRLAKALVADARFEKVLTVSGAFSDTLTAAQLLEFVPDARLQRYLSADRRTVLFDLYPVLGHQPSALAAIVRDLRAQDLVALYGISGEWYIGGLPGGVVDYEDAVRYWLPRVVAIVAMGSFLALAIGFRSLLIPAKAVVLNLLAVLASYGAVVLVFIEGFGIQLFGLEAGLSGIFPTTPVLVFCAAYGISMDYEVFLLSRIREERLRTGSDREAVIEGLAQTGRLITRAAAIMTVVFGAFALSEILPTQILGFALAFVVAIDALVIRVALGPALITLAGRWNWWPSRMDFEPTPPEESIKRV